MIRHLSLILLTTLTVGSCTAEEQSSPRLRRTHKILLTSEAGDKLASMGNVSFQSGTADGTVISVHPDRTKQIIDGIGSSFTESSAFVLAQLQPEKRRELMQEIYGESGANFTLTRTHIGSCDFSVRGKYSYADVEGDTALANFNIAPDIEVFFAPLATLPTYIPEYVEGNWGFFYISWDDNKRITHCKVAVATDVTSHQERQHLIREEVTQSLGLINDSWLYSGSIFYQGWTTTTAYAPIDRALIEMLYRTEVQPGMSQSATLGVLSGL